MGVNPVTVGQVYGRLTVTSEPARRPTASGKGNPLKGECRCECGDTIFVGVDNLRSGNTKSCGCLQKDRMREAVRKHGEAKTRLYWVWLAMRGRCNNPNDPGFKRYGARGIVVCPEWESDYCAFRDWAVASGYGEGQAGGHARAWLERIDNDGPYSPGNCRWATPKEQANNTRRNRRITAFGETKFMHEWADDPRCLVKRLTLHGRLKAGWPPEDAMTKPIYSVYRKAT